MGGVALIYSNGRCGLVGCLLLTGHLPSHGQGTVMAADAGAPVSLAVVYRIRPNFEKGIETF